MNDKEILKKLKNKDEQAFNIFIDNYFKLFYKIAQRILRDMSSHEEIMDCLSESFIYIWYHLDNYNPEKYSLRNWCSLIVINRAQNHFASILRHRKKVIRFQEYVADNKTYDPSAENVYIQNKSEKDLISKINDLSPLSRTVFKLRYINGLKPKQIAAEMSITVKQVDNYLTYAKKKLRKDGVIDENE